jgi:hypothetical protein
MIVSRNDMRASIARLLAKLTRQRAIDFEQQS